MIVAAILARNEADRYLARVIANCQALCDRVLVVDDHSEDDTLSLAADLGCVTSQTRSDAGFWGRDETAARAQLWLEATALAGQDGWVYVADADHELVGIDRDGMQMLTRSNIVTCWAWPLADCWDSDALMRIDGYWQAHTTPRPWMFRVSPTATYAPHWDRKAIHAGHAPHNYPMLAGTAPGFIRHLGYVEREARERKSKRYLDLAEVAPSAAL